MANEISAECQEVLRLFTRSRNVIISGSPGTGKSRLLAEVAKVFFEGIKLPTSSGPPVHRTNSTVPIPPSLAEEKSDLESLIPAATKTKRQVFRTVFHQNSKHRDFLTGILPVISKPEDGQNFRVIQGSLYKASEFAKNNGASLLIIDEINRGPAVQVFGGSIVAMETGKRLADDGTPHTETQFFEIMDPNTGDIIEYALPSDLFILAAMNQADASIEPLDIAFLRRWEPMKLQPNLAVLRQYYNLVPNKQNFPEVETEASHVFEASISAWEAVNKKIALGRSPEFQIGHGVLIYGVDTSSMNLQDAKAFVSLGWNKILSHVEEVFFGDIRSIAATYNALEGPKYNPFSLIETTFADNLRYKLEGPSKLTEKNIYAFLRAVSELGES